MEVMVETTLRMAEQDLEARQLFQECQEGHFSGFHWLIIILHWSDIWSDWLEIFIYNFSDIFKSLITYILDDDYPQPLCLAL